MAEFGRESNSGEHCAQRKTCGSQLLVHPRVQGAWALHRAGKTDICLIDSLSIHSSVLVVCGCVPRRRDCDDARMRCRQCSIFCAMIPLSPSLCLTYFFAPRATDYLIQTPTVVTAAGLFLTGTKKQQQFIKVGTLLRLQPNPDVRLFCCVEIVHTVHFMYWKSYPLVTTMCRELCWSQ